MTGDDSPKRLISYLRVSTDEQAASGLGLAAQQHQLERAFDYEGWELVETIRDEGESGKDLDRPGLRRALERIAAGEADGLVVAKLDRLSRSVVDFGDLCDWFEHAGATLIALDFKLDTSSAAGNLVAGIFMAVAEWERRTIGERTKNAMAAKRAAGEPTGRPSVVDNAKLVARVHELRSEGRSLSQVAATLTAEEWPTVRGGTTWRPSALQSILGYERPKRRRRRAELPDVPRRR